MVPAPAHCTSDASIETRSESGEDRPTGQRSNTESHASQLKLTRVVRLSGTGVKDVQTAFREAGRSMSPERMSSGSFEYGSDAHPKKVNPSREHSDAVGSE